MRAATVNVPDPFPRAAFFALLAASVAILGGAFAFQLIGGLRPCELCIWQRYPYAIAIGLAGIGLGLARANMDRRLLAVILLILAVTFLVGAGIAGFHVGVEQKWWSGTDACVGSVSGVGSIEDLRRALDAAPVTRCDQIAWSLFGISMAGYNLLLSAALAVASLLAARRM